MTRSALDLEALYHQHNRALLRWFARRTADAEVAMDLWAETFAQATLSAPRFRGATPADAAGWLYAIARHQLALYQRKGAAEDRALRKLGLERPPAGPDVLAQVERETSLPDLRRELDSALISLSDRQRDAVELRVVLGLTYTEVARRLDITETAARARVSRSLQALAESLDPEAIGELR
jgi:RNA polymerase sigma factor (sigma-70 family)